MMLEKKFTDFTEELSSAKPVPGGGGACAAVGAFAAALGMMVANLTAGKKRYADVEEEVMEILARLKTTRNISGQGRRGFRTAFESVWASKRHGGRAEGEREDHGSGLV